MAPPLHERSQIVIGFERPLSILSSHSQIRRRGVLHQHSYGRFRLLAALQLFEKLSLGSAAIGHERAFELIEIGRFGCPV